VVPDTTRSSGAAFPETLRDAVFVVRDNFKAAFALLCILTSDMHVTKGQDRDVLIAAVRDVDQSQTLRNLILWCTFWASSIAAALTLVTAWGAWKPNSGLSADIWIHANAWSAVYVAGRTACLIGVPALLAIAVRDAMKRLETWKPWHGNLPPASQYLRASALPILACGPLLVSWEVSFYVLKQIVQGTPESLTERNLATTVRLAYTAIILLIPTVVPLCFFVCGVADIADSTSDPKHSKARRIVLQIVWLLSLTGAYLLIGLRVAIHRGARPLMYDSFDIYVAKETLLLIVPLLAFACLFALSVERRR
jgi:hypothetical protein